MEDDTEPNTMHVKRSIANTVIQYKGHGIKRLSNLNRNTLLKLILFVDKKYYKKNKPLLTDAEYDILKEYALGKHPDLKEELKGHEKITVEKNKAVLPYYLGSMNKVKPDTSALKNWLKKYNNTTVISGKADGMSALYHKGKLYTRGNGKVGQDISYLIPYLKLPKNKPISIRGELIIKKKTFEEKYAKQFANPRNFVAGTINAKSLTTNVVKDIDFLAYELINPVLNPSRQMDILGKLNVLTIINEHKQLINNEILSSYLIRWRKEYEYELDGIVVADDAIYERTNENPKHAFAFKMVLTEQIAEAHVVDVIWQPSKHGYLKPRVRIMPITIGGSTIEYCTGHNAAFIYNNNIGLGSVVSMVKSGDVIPKIQKVIKKSDKPKMPNVKCTWNDTKIDLVIDDKDNNETVLMKNIQLFFDSLDVVGLGEGNVKRIMKAGFNSIEKILCMTIQDFMKVDGFKLKMSEKIKTSIDDRIKSASIIDIMNASNILGRGLGLKKIKKIMQEYPEVLISMEKDEIKIAKIEKINGFANKTAKVFVTYIDEFLRFLHKTNLLYKLKEIEELKSKKKNSQNKTNNSSNHFLNNKNIVFTGVRNKGFEKLITSDKYNANIKSSISKTTNYLIIKNKETKGKKVEKVIELNKQEGVDIKILTLEEIIIMVKKGV